MTKVLVKAAATYHAPILNGRVLPSGFLGLVHSEGQLLAVETRPVGSASDVQEGRRQIRVAGDNIDGLVGWDARATDI